MVEVAYNIMHQQVDKISLVYNIFWCGLKLHSDQLKILRREGMRRGIAQLIQI